MDGNFFVDPNFFGPKFLDHITCEILGKNTGVLGTVVSLAPPSPTNTQNLRGYLRMGIPVKMERLNIIIPEQNIKLNTRLCVCLFIELLSSL